MTPTLRFSTKLTLTFALLYLTATSVLADPRATDPVLMVIANQDFSFQEYAATRSSLEAAGLEVVVAATTTDTAIPQGLSPRSSVDPDLALSDVHADDYSAIVFVGGWGSSSYQYAFEGTYSRPAYQVDDFAASIVNGLIKQFVAENKPTAAICHGVSVLAWAQVDGASPIAGRVVVAFAGGIPAFRLDGKSYGDAEIPVRWQIEANGAKMLTSGSVGDPTTANDDVIVDGNLITAENWTSASAFAEAIAQAVASGR